MTAESGPSERSERPGVRLLLLRHGQVPHHRGDVAPTDLGLAQGDAAGRWHQPHVVQQADELAERFALVLRNVHFAIVVEALARSWADLAFRHEPVDHRGR